MNPTSPVADPATRPVRTRGTGSFDGEDPADPLHARWSVQRVLGLLVVIVLAAFWAWAFSPWAPSAKADAIGDKAFLAEAEAACRSMEVALDSLPPAAVAATANARADVIAQSAAPIATLIAELKAASASLTGRDADLVAQWIADWETYAADRQAYATALRTDPKALFIVSQRGTGQITKTMDGFSRVNDLAPCLVPTDV